MRIEDFKVWHWMLLGTLIGLAIGYSRVSMGNDDGGMVRSVGVERFAENLARRQPNGTPWIRNVVVYPPSEGKHYVTFDMLESLGNGKGAYRASKMYADIPFKMVNRPAPRENYTILDFIREQQSRADFITASYAWWREPNWQYLICGGAGFVIIGVLWPILLNLLTGAGFGRPRLLSKDPSSEKKEEYDLSRFGKGTHPDSAKTGPKRATQADLDAVEDLNATLAQRLANRETETLDLSSQSSQTTAPARNWSAASEPASLPPSAPAEEHVYDGEFYPVDRGVKKKAD
jgi:hypothetical protein